MYEIGDRIVYPMHGAGVIESIEEKLFLGNMQSYYVLRIPMRDMKVMIPVISAGDIGIRKIVGKQEVNQILMDLSQKNSNCTINWNKRYRENMEKIKTGDVFEVADVYKSLMAREKEKGLSTGERKMLSTARQILLSELTLAEDTSIDEMENRIKKCLDY